MRTRRGENAQFVAFSTYGVQDGQQHNVMYAGPSLPEALKKANAGLRSKQRLKPDKPQSVYRAYGAGLTELTLLDFDRAFHNPLI
jgi:hypothetical protein